MKQIFEWDMSLYKNNSWGENLRSLCKCIGMELEMQSRCPVNISLAKARLMHQYTQIWKNKIASQTKLENYCKIKKDWGATKYITVGVDKCSRSLACKLKLGVLPLQIEQGRYSGQTREQRICKLCNSELENELHFLFKCPKLVANYDELAAKVPELKNEILLHKRWEMLKQKPFVYSEYLRKLWNKRNNLMTNIVNSVK